jgi:hypothetical protein
MRSRDEDSETAIERVRGYPRFMWIVGVPATNETAINPKRLGAVSTVPHIQASNRAILIVYANSQTHR